MDNFTDYIKRLDYFKKPVTFTVNSSYKQGKDNKNIWNSYASWSGFILTLVGVLTLLTHGFTKIKQINNGELDLLNTEITGPQY